MHGPCVHVTTFFLLDLACCSFFLPTLLLLLASSSLSPPSPSFSLFTENTLHRPLGSYSHPAHAISHPLHKPPARTRSPLLFSALTLRLFFCYFPFALVSFPTALAF